MKPHAIFMTIAVALCAAPHVALADARTARKELEATYGKIAQAIQRKDLKTWMSYCAPDYSEKGTDGKIVKRHQLEMERRGALNTAQSLVARFDVAQVTTKANSATAVVRYALIMVTKAALDPQKKTHRIVAIAPLRQQWTKSAKGWLLQRSETLGGGAVTIDDKPARVH